MSTKKTNEELFQFLEHIANNVGETVTEYHWREACALIKEYKDREENKPITVTFGISHHMKYIEQQLLEHGRFTSTWEKIAKHMGWDMATAIQYYEREQEREFRQYYAEHEQREFARWLDKQDTRYQTYEEMLEVYKEEKRLKKLGGSIGNSPTKR